MLVEPVAEFVAVESAERHGRQFDLEAAPVAEEAVHEDLAGVAEADAVGRLVEGAGEHEAPEAVDGAGRLAVAAEPVEERRVGVGRRPPQSGQPPGDANLVGETEVMGAEEGAGEVKRRGQAVGGEAADAAVGRHEVEAGLGLKEMGDADGLAKMGEVGAAAHADVLAGVDELSGGGVGEGTGPAAEAVARFEHGDVEAALGERRGGRQSRQPAADDDDPIRHACSIPGIVKRRRFDKIGLRSRLGYSTKSRDDGAFRRRRMFPR